LPVSTIIAAAATTAALVGADLAESERYRILAPYFRPAPGDAIEVNPNDIINDGVTDPLKLAAVIHVQPPKGVCFTITRDEDERDRRICQPEELKFRLEEIDKAGRITWKIKTGKGDFGHSYHWQTPHRIADVIPAGKKLDKLHEKVVIRGCSAHNSDANRRLFLKLMNGKYWVINFPEKDLLLPQPDEPPNLFIAGARADAGLSADSKAPQAKSQRKKGERAQHNDPVTRYWAVPDRRSFRMNASNFKTADAAPGMRGECHYQLKDAPHDPTSGWIECHETDDFDVVFVHLTCANAIVTN